MHYCYQTLYHFLSFISSLSTDPQRASCGGNRSEVPLAHLPGQAAGRHDRCLQGGAQTAATGITIYAYIIGHVSSYLVEMVY